jgi:hypothetical protein
LKLLALAFAAGALTTPAWATLTVSLGGTNSGGAITGGTSCADGSLCDSNPTANQVFWSTTTGAGVFSINVQGQDVAGIASLSWAINGTPTATGSFTFAISDNGFSSPVPPVYLSANVSGSSANPGGVVGNLQGQGFVSGTPTNTDFTTNDGSTGVFNVTGFTGPATGASSMTGPFSSGSPYSLTEFVTVTITALSTATDKTFQVTGNVSTAPVPEPTSIVLFSGVALMAFGAIRRKVRLS